MIIGRVLPKGGGHEARLVIGFHILFTDIHLKHALTAISTVAILKGRRYLFHKHFTIDASKSKLIRASFQKELNPT